MSRREKHISRNFSYSDLAGHDLSDTDFLDCNFHCANLTGTNLARSNLWRSDFTGAKLQNAIISLNCFTFRQTKFDSYQVDHLVYLLLLANIPDDQRHYLAGMFTAKRLQQLEELFGPK